MWRWSCQGTNCSKVAAPAAEAKSSQHAAASSCKLSGSKQILPSCQVDPHRLPLGYPGLRMRRETALPGCLFADNGAAADVITKPSNLLLASGIDHQHIATQHQTWAGSLPAYSAADQLIMHLLCCAEQSIAGRDWPVKVG